MAKETRLNRVALVPSCADPILASFFFSFFNNVWQDEVDRLHFHVNAGPSIESKIINYIERISTKNPKVTFKFCPQYDGYGSGVDYLINDSQEDHIVLLEDDAFIFKRGVLDEQFKKLESGEFDVLGSPRGSVNEKILQHQMKVYGLDAGGYDWGPNFWPCYLFFTRDIIKKTDMNFRPKTWKKGERIEQIDFVVDDECSGDTGTWVSIQLRSLTGKIGIIPQYKCFPIDFDLRKNKEWTFSGDAGWIHSGSGSSGLNMYLRTEEGVPLRWRNNPFNHRVTVKPIDNLMERWDYEMRTAFWYLFIERMNDSLGIEDFLEDYKSALERLVVELGLDRGQIEERKRMYEGLIYG